MNRIVGGGALALAATAAGAFYVDSQEIYCLSTHCSQVVEEKRLAAEAKQLRQMVEAERRENIASAKSLGSELNETIKIIADDRARSLQELNEEARNAKRGAQSDENAGGDSVWVNRNDLLRSARGEGVKPK